jgi:small subunit ribosomal protein S10
MISSVQISLKSFEYKLLETATSQILASIPSTWKISEFVFPLKIKKFTVLRSPHIDKKSREQFQIKFYKKNISLHSPSQSRCNLPAIAAQQRRLAMQSNPIAKQPAIMGATSQPGDPAVGHRAAETANQVTENLMINHEDSEIKNLIFIENLKHIQLTGVQLQVQIFYKSYFI